MKLCDTSNLRAFVFVTGLAICGIGLWLLLCPALYQATTRIMVENPPPPGVFHHPGLGYYEYEEIRSKIVLGKVAAVLAKDEERAEKTVTSSESLQDLRRQLSMTMIDGKHFELKLSDNDPVRASRILNMIAESY